MKEKLFKILFPSEYKKLQKWEAMTWTDDPIFPLQQQVKKLEIQLDNDLLKPIDFANVDTSAKPPHPLEGLSDSQRKNALARLESIYTDNWYIKMRDYSINVIANHSFQKEQNEMKMRNGRYAVIGIRTLDKQFENGHNEFKDSKKISEDFDPLDPIPG